jgi:hypothetical protein
MAVHQSREHKLLTVQANAFHREGIRISSTFYHTKRRRKCTSIHQAHNHFGDLSLVLCFILLIISPRYHSGFNIVLSTARFDAFLPICNEWPKRWRQYPFTTSSQKFAFEKRYTFGCSRPFSLAVQKDSGNAENQDGVGAFGQSSAEAPNGNVTVVNDAFIKSIRKTLQKIDPYGAGYQFRRTLDSAISTLAGSPPAAQAALDLYYLEDRLFALESSSVSGRKPYDPQTVPEVLVVGATTKIGQLIVRRLILRGIRVRALVPNLYSSTLDLFGTKVVYCVGDILDIESLEYAVTDVDKIIFCLSSSEEDSDNDPLNNKGKVGGATLTKHYSLQDVYVTGMNNLLHAYQNVRFADYGAGQAAKRLLFKFRRPEDFGLFNLENEVELQQMSEGPWMAAAVGGEGRDKTIVRKNQWSCWERNKFNNTSFYGRINSSPDGQVAILSTRLRARKKVATNATNNTISTNLDESEEEPEGIDLSRGFSGFIVRLCGDGQQYECFVRTKAYDLLGIEYVYNFSTLAKSNGTETILNKFQTIRMPFTEFKPIYQRRSEEADEEQERQTLQSLPKFSGRDVRHVGFRYRSSSNMSGRKNVSGSGTVLSPTFNARRSRMQGFYLALSYIKLYRSNMEPELVYLSDSRIPQYVRSEFVQHDKKQLILSNSLSPSEKDTEYTLFNLHNLNHPISADDGDKSHEVAYYKYLGEQILRQSGLR